MMGGKAALQVYCVCGATRDDQRHSYCFASEDSKVNECDHDYILEVFANYNEEELS
jgi:hypothetical protein